MDSKEKEISFIIEATYDAFGRPMLDYDISKEFLTGIKMPVPVFPQINDKIKNTLITSLKTNNWTYINKQNYSNRQPIHFYTSSPMIFVTEKIPELKPYVQEIKENIQIAIENSITRINNIHTTHLEKSMENILLEEIEIQFFSIKHGKILRQELCCSGWKYKN